LTPLLVVAFVLFFVYSSYNKEYFYKHYLPRSEPDPKKSLLHNFYEHRNKEFKIDFPHKHVFFGKPFLTKEVEKSLLEVGLPKSVSLIFRDENYCFVESAWFDEYALWWIIFVKNNNVEFKRNNFDCDNFSDLFMAIYGLASLSADIQPYSQVACGTVIVENNYEFAGIPALEDSWHSLNIVWTNIGWFVIEPQNGTYISLESYPNKNNIKAIVF
jgi:hypothetical protein